MVKVSLFTGYNVKKDENVLGKKYATEDFIKRHGYKPVEGSEIEVGENEVDTEGFYVPRI